MSFLALKRIYFNKEKNYHQFLLALLFILILFAISVALQHYFIIEKNSKQHYSLLWHVSFNLFYWLYWILIFPLISKIVKKFYREKFGDYVVLYLVAPLIFVSIHQVISAVVINLVLDYLDIKTLIYRRILRNQWLWVDIVVYFIISTGIYVVEKLEENKKEEIKLSRLKNSITQSQIKLLQSQIHPHFLFNTFNTLSTFILKEDRENSIKLIKSIKEFIAKSTKEYNTLIPLGEELFFVKSYLEIEKLRYGEKFSYIIDCTEDAKNIFIPNFIIQPIVENSIRHGISKKSKDGFISISINCEYNYLIIRVEDNGEGINENNKHNGLGLKIIKSQLEYFFEDKYEFYLLKSNLGGLKVHIKIPCYKKEEAFAYAN
ncbi:MAG: histidine kinase [Melioribacter sp.]|nr:histidine kinase [Melioribacter sp.]